MLAAAPAVGPAVGAECYAWPLRYARGAVAIDGDTVRITMPGLPPELAKISVRLAGIDAPALGGRAKCPAERALADRAKARLEELLTETARVSFCDVRWGRYGGRVLADVVADGHPIRFTLIDEGLALPYEGGPRRSWCTSD